MEENKRIEEIKNRMIEIMKEQKDLNEQNDASSIRRTQLELERGQLQKEFEEIYKELQEEKANTESEKVSEEETSKKEEYEKVSEEEKHAKVLTVEAPAQLFSEKKADVMYMNEEDEQSPEEKSNDGDLKVNFVNFYENPEQKKSHENKTETKPVETVVKEFVEEKENQESVRDEEAEVIMDVPEEERKKITNNICKLNIAISYVNARIEDIMASLNSSISDQERSELQSELEDLSSKRTVLETELSELDNSYDVKTRPVTTAQQSNEEQEPNEIKPGEKDVKKKEKNNEVGYKVGPIKGILLRVVKKIRSFLKDDSVLANWCENIEDALLTSSTPVALNPAKVPVESIGEKMVEDMAVEDMKWLSEQAKNMPEDSLMMDIIGEKLDEAKDRFEKKDVQIEEGLAAHYMKENNIPEVLNKPMANVIMYESTKKILDMAKDEGIKTTSGRFSKSERRSLEDIYKDLDEKLKLREEMNKIVQKDKMELYPHKERETERRNDEIGK